LQFLREPSAILSRPWHAGASIDDGAELLIHADGIVAIAQVFCQRAADMQVFWLEHHARRQSPPTNGLVFAVPRKNAALVRGKQTFCV